MFRWNKEIDLTGRCFLPNDNRIWTILQNVAKPQHPFRKLRRSDERRAVFKRRWFRLKKREKEEKNSMERITPRQRFSASDAAGIHVAIRAHWMNKLQQVTIRAKAHVPSFIARLIPMLRNYNVR